jgi:hypothetical protein
MEDGLALEFDQTAFDFGEILDTEVLTHEFHFTNAAAVTVQLSDDTGCPCALLASFNKASYAPGERGVLYLSLYPKRRTGVVRYAWTGQVKERPGESMRRSFPPP